MALEPKFIGKEDVAKLLNPRILLDRLENALGKMSLGKDGGVEQPMRSAVSVEKHRGWVEHGLTFADPHTCCRLPTCDLVVWETGNIYELVADVQF